MDHRERFFRTIARESVDRNASWLGLPTEQAIPGLLSYFGVASLRDLKEKLDDDIFPIEMPYESESSHAIYTALNFAKYPTGSDFDRTLTVPGFFEGMEDPEQVDLFDWPDPSWHIDPEKCRDLAKQAPSDSGRLGVIWSAHFQETCAAFGMENALITMVTCEEMFRAVDARIVQFYLDANEIFYEATRGDLDAVLIGNDVGSQKGLIISPQQVRDFVLPGSRRLIEQAKSYGLKVFYHSCGSIEPIIDDLIECGVDVIHPIQALATGMEPHHLRDRFGNRVSFCGGVDAQELLVNGTPDNVFKATLELRRIFPTGLIVSPSHEAILPDVNPANIDALFRAVHESLD